VTLREAGRRGGAATSAKYGREFYKAIGAKSGTARVGRKRGGAVKVPAEQRGQAAANDASVGTPGEGDPSTPALRTVRQAGHLGGTATAARHGSEFYRRIGAKGGRAMGSGEHC
jgi:general stress protein YciG